MRTLIYARYSSELQNSRSIEDQIAVCRDRATAESWTVVDIFTDYAISGAAGIGEGQRPGLNALLSRVEAGGIDQVLAESTSRISRHQGDDFAIRERLKFAGARLFTLSDGEIDDFKGTIRALLDAHQRKDIAANVKRGQRGSVSAGRAPAGLAYGYRKANKLDAKGELVRGLREIDDEQAEVVRRIFAEYAAGHSPRAIASRLNIDGVPAPRTGTWRASTIAGDRIRKNGMLQNQLYIGVLVHERTSKIPDPTTRRERIRANPESAWFSQDVPELRIVDQETWDRCAELRSAHDGIPATYLRRPKRLLSGLTTCGLCGGGWNVIGRERWGCGKHRDGGGCTNNRTISTHLFEERVLKGLQESLLDPALVSAYVREYHEARAKRVNDAQRERSKLTRRHGEAQAKVERLVEAIANGADEFVEIRAVLAKARADRDTLAQQLGDLDALPVIALHPGVAREYREQVAALGEALANNGKASVEAIPKLRALIGRVIVTPSANQRGVNIELQGRLKNMLDLAAGNPASDALYVMNGAGSGDRTRITSLEG